MPVPPEIRHLHDEIVLVDLHAHPCMKTYLSRKRLHRAVKPAKGFSPFKLRCNLPALEAGGVDILLSAIYVPEARLKRDCWAINPVAWFNRRLRRALKDDPFDTTCKMLESFEAEIDSANEHHPGRKATVVRSLAALDVALADPRRPITILHTVEGAHSLSGKLGNLERLFEAGVCLMTLAHFYPNGVAHPVMGIPHTNFLTKIGCFNWKPDLGLPLPDFGREVVDAMLNLGMLVDLTHTTPPARKEVIELNSARNGNRRPLMITHTGAASIFDNPMNANPSEIKAIADSGGVVGVIFMTDWLVGPHRPGDDNLQQVVRTIEALINAGGEDCVSLGSDFDGMTDPPNDLRDPAEFPLLTRALLDKFNPEQVRKFLGANALRAIREGWGR